MPSYKYLGNPFQIGGLTIKNRFCMAPVGGGQHHLPGGGLKDETIQYLVERAKGGFGLILPGHWPQNVPLIPIQESGLPFYKIRMRSK